MSLLLLILNKMNSRFSFSVFYFFLLIYVSILCFRYFYSFFFKRKIKCFSLILLALDNSVQWLFMKNKYVQHVLSLCYWKWKPEPVPTL